MLSNRTFRILNTFSDIVFILSMAGLIYYSTFMSETIKWEMAVPLALLTCSYLLIFKPPEFIQSILRDYTILRPSYLSSRGKVKEAMEHLTPWLLLVVIPLLIINNRRIRIKRQYLFRS
ncbi:hypothetical protein SAMN05216353_102110 [Halobacillus alkaliphilus]|uniref:Uncharacterized protein n=1 Tax=Halobacillus alkaliphilus TaxID=396056 RepID=A0A1I2JUL4_9BACI|nr:hypothetical protein SAMN05216353_102110 [Halobacillus alkaliphilus]